MTFIEGIRLKYMLCFTYLTPKQTNKQIPLQVDMLLPIPIHTNS